MNNIYSFVNTGIKPNKQGDEHVHFSVTIAINGKPVTKEACLLYTSSGESRTGCMFCAFGEHLEPQPNKFQRMQITHPKQWEYCMKPVDQGGLGLSIPLDYIGCRCV